MFRRVSIQNFRSIEDAQVDLAPFTLLVGPNGSGKSNFADAFVFARDVGIDASSAVSRRGGITGVRRWAKSKPYDVTIDVRAATTVDQLDTNYQRHLIRLSSGAEGRWFFKREEIESVGPAKSGPDFHLTRTPTKIESDAEIRLTQLPETTSAMLIARQLTAFRRRNSLGSVRRYRINPDVMRQPQGVTENSRLDETGANIGGALRRMRERSPHDFDATMHAMGRIVPGLVEVEVKEVGRFLTLNFRQASSSGVAEFSATEMSEGALRALGIIVAARQMVADELLIIEEPEVNIHAGAATMLFEILKDAANRGAVLVTTHSAELLDAARDEEILVCAYSDGVTRIGPLDLDQRAKVRGGLFSVAELMRSETLRIQGELPLILNPRDA